MARRVKGKENADLPTGDIELRGHDVTILSESKTPPFYINEPDAPIDESLRLRYRYLDLRREPMRDRLLLRSRLVQEIRDIHHANGFVDIETPDLIKSTPEGARDFIVPSRLQPGTHSRRPALDTFEGTVVAVSHDRAFLRRLDRFLMVLGDGSVRAIPDYARAHEALVAPTA